MLTKEDNEIFKLILEEYFGYEIDINHNPNNGIVIDGEVPSFVFSAFESDFLHPLVLANEYISKYLENEINYPLNPQFITEQISLSLLNSGDDDDNKALSDFVQCLKDMSIKTYESKPAEVLIVFFPNDLSEENNEFFNEMGIEYLPFDSHIKLRDLFEHDKLSRIMLNGNALALLVNKDYSIMGLLRKRTLKVLKNFY